MFAAFLLAIAEVYLKEGDNEYSKGEADNAVHFYTEGLQVNCKDIQVNAVLYSNRAAAHLLLGKNWSFVPNIPDLHSQGFNTIGYSSGCVREGTRLFLCESNYAASIKVTWWET